MGATIDLTAGQLRAVIDAGRRLDRVIRANVATNNPDVPNPPLETWASWGDTYHRAPDNTPITVTMPADHAEAANRWLAWSEA